MFFKSHRVEIRHVLEKNCFFAYSLRSEFYGIIRLWIQEAFWARAGKIIKSTVTEPNDFEDALLSLYRRWSLEPKMMDLVARREKDVVKNQFARIGLFEAREAKFVRRKLNRFFTTHTFYDNFPYMKTDEITKFVIENNMMDLLAERFIDYRYIKLLLENLDVIYMKDELILIEKMRTLMEPETDLDEFLMMVNATSDYICEFDKNFDRNTNKLRLINETFRGLPANNFQAIADINPFTQNLMMKIQSQNEKLPTVEQLFEDYHSINLDFVRDEFEMAEDGGLTVSFDDPNLCASFADTTRLTSINYVQRYQSAFGTYLLIKDILKNFNTISRSQIIAGCEEVAKLAVEYPDNRELVSHVMTFLEIFSVDTRNLRSLLRLMKLKPNDDSKAFDEHLNELITVEATDSGLCNVEALEVYWRTKRIENPPRSYLSTFIARNDWFHFVLLAQYLNYPIREFISICDKRIENPALRDNLIRAVLNDSSPELKKRCSFSKRRRSRAGKTEVSTKLNRICDETFTNFFSGGSSAVPKRKIPRHEA